MESAGGKEVSCVRCSSLEKHGLAARGAEERAGGSLEGVTYVRAHRHRPCGLFRRLPLSFKWERGAFVVPDTLTHQSPAFCPVLSAPAGSPGSGSSCPPHLRRAEGTAGAGATTGAENRLSGNPRALWSTTPRSDETA